MLVDGLMLMLVEGKITCNRMKLLQDLTVRGKLDRMGRLKNTPNTRRILSAQQILKRVIRVDMMRSSE